MEDKYLKQVSFVIPGIPMSKSNNSIHNAAGVKILSPEYIQYEESIANIARLAAKGKKFQYKTITYVKVFFKKLRQHVDLNNMPKSICDGIEKSGIIDNDIDISTIYFEEDFDLDNPRVEVTMYCALAFKPKFLIEEKTEEEKQIINDEYNNVMEKKKKNLIANEKRKARLKRIDSIEEKIEKSEQKKTKAIKKAEKSSNKTENLQKCSICNNSLDKSLMSKISGKNQYICRRCILCGYGR